LSIDTDEVCVIMCHKFTLNLELKMEQKVVYEIKLSRPVMIVAVMAAVGLLAIGAKPLLEATPAFAQSSGVQKIAICESNGRECVALSTANRLKVAATNR
jgi:hypothetical protein